MTDTLKQEIARVLNQWFIEHDGEEIDCPALATAALSVVQPRIERLEEENADLKAQIAAIMRGELLAPDIDPGKPMDALKTSTLGKRDFAALTHKETEA